MALLDRERADTALPQLEEETRKLETRLKEVETNRLTPAMLNAIWPVGSYYDTSDSAFDPNVSWGGTWQREVHDDLVYLVAETTATGDEMPPVYRWHRTN